MGGFGSGGHNRKSARLHKIQGTYRKDRHAGRGGIPTVGEARKTPPKWLDKEAKAFWRKYAPLCVEIGTLDALSESLFIALCCQWSHWRSMRAQIEKEGAVYETKRGARKAHPLVSICHRTLKDFASLASEFGMTPRGRKRLGIEVEPPQAVDVEKNPFEKLGGPTLPRSWS